MSFDNVNPFVRYAKLHTAFIPRREAGICYDCRLFYVFKGEGEVMVDGISYAVHAHTALFFPPKTVYFFTFSAPREVQIGVLNFDMTDAYSYEHSSLGTATPDTFDERRVHAQTVHESLCRPIVQPHAAACAEHVSVCIDVFLKQEPYRRAIASAHLKIVLFELLRESEQVGVHRLLQQIRAFLMERYADPSLSNEQIGAHFGYHPGHLSRLMRAHTGSSLHEYLLSYRLHSARNLLLTTDLSVTEIAERVGFSSYNYFIKYFREKVGQSPLQYRKRCEGAVL